MAVGYQVLIGFSTGWLKFEGYDTFMIVMKQASIYLNAIHGENHSGRPPIWMMRQAGRYMPEYRAIREKHGFLEMIRTPEVACEITLQPLYKFGFDAAILFSDILVTAEALGSPVQFIEKQGPVFEHPIRTMVDVNALSAGGYIDKLHYVMDAIRMVKAPLAALQTPLIGFAGAPFTVASYMIEGKSSPDLKTTKQLMMRHPAVLHALLEKLATVTTVYLNAQIEAGVDSLQLFDTWAMHLSWADFRDFSLPYISKILTGLHNPNSVPVTMFCRGSSYLAPLIATLPIQAMSMDWGCSLSEIRRQFPRLALQGNLDPFTLYASPEILDDRVDALLDEMAGDPGFIFNLGHGLMPDMAPEQVQRVVDRVKSRS